MCDVSTCSRVSGSKWPGSTYLCRSRSCSRPRVTPDVTLCMVTDTCEYYPGGGSSCWPHRPGSSSPPTYTGTEDSGGCLKKNALIYLNLISHNFMRFISPVHLFNNDGGGGGTLAEVSVLSLWTDTKGLFGTDDGFCHILWDHSISRRFHHNEILSQLTHEANNRLQTEV